MKLKIYNNIRENKNVYGLLISFLFLIGIMEFYRNYSLKDSKFTYAIFVGYKGGVGNAEEYFSYYNVIEDRSIVINGRMKLKNDLQIGDTVWIRYSKDDSKIIEVVDLDYKKYMTAKTKSPVIK